MDIDNKDNQSSDTSNPFMVRREFGILDKPYKLDTKKLRGNYTNRYLTDGLFFERPGSSMSNCVFTLEEQDDLTNGLHSLYKLFIDSDDLTEYKIATDVFGSTTHWDRLCQCKWFQPYLSKMREDLKRKLRSKAIAEIMDMVLSTSSDAVRLNALKYLSKEGIDFFEDVPVSRIKRGRPTKEEVRGNLHIITKEAQDVLKDYERILN